MSIQIGTSFSLSFVSKMGLVGKKQILKDANNKIIAYVQGVTCESEGISNTVDTNINFYEDEKMTIPLISISKGVITDSLKNMAIASFTHKCFVSTNPISITTIDGKKLEFRIGNIVIPILRNLQTINLLIPAKYGVYEGEKLIAIYSMPIVMGNKKVNCEVKDMSYISDPILNELLACMASLIICY